MRNIVGKPVSGQDFFKRDNLLNKIYRRLDTGAHLFFAAPRRVGKTSIMYFLRDNPREDYAFIYVNTEDVNDTEQFFKRLFEELLNSDIVTETVKRSKKAERLFKNVSERVKKIGLFGFEIEFDKATKGKYSTEFAGLMRELETDGFSIVIMVDEFPSTIENIRQEHGDDEAVKFLKLNRRIRQEAKESIRFIYTGSIGLPNIVKDLNTPESINDLNEVEIPPLTHTEGRLFAQKLLNTVNVDFELSAIDYLLDKIRWLMPFFVQISIQELIDEYEMNHEPINNAIVDKAFEKIVNRRNNIHFESYYNRLKDAFAKDDYEIVIQILSKIAAATQLSKEILFENIETEKDKKRVFSLLDSLEFDGYINKINGAYQFNSPILQRWWNKYVV